DRGEADELRIHRHGARAAVARSRDRAARDRGRDHEQLRRGDGANGRQPRLRNDRDLRCDGDVRPPRPWRPLVERRRRARAVACEPQRRIRADRYDGRGAARMTQSLEAFLRPLYQDLDGASRFDAVERVTAIATRLHEPTRELELLILFQGLGAWLDKVGNLSRTALVTGIDEAELRRIAAAVKRLDAPVTAEERAVAAAIAIDNAGVRGLAERLARSRREGSSVADVAREELRHRDVPSWMPLQAVVWLGERAEARRRVCEAILAEMAGPD